MTTLEQQLEAVLFWKGEPMRRKDLAAILGADEGAVAEALGALRSALKGRGVALVENGDEVSLATAPHASEAIERLERREREGDIGRAGLETLTIVLYRGPLSRREIEYIRGVNSQFILRNLLIRGLIERVENPKDVRIPLYRGTTELLASLGLTKREELPEFKELERELADLAKASVEEPLSPEGADKRTA